MADTLTKSELKWFKRDTCPVCHRSRWKELYNERLIRLLKCKDCGVKFLNPCLDESSTASIYQSSDTLKEINPFLEHYYEESPDQVWNSITGKDYKKVLDWAAKHAPGKDILDVASGNGIFLGFAKKRGWRCEGVDPSEKNADFVELQYDVPVAVSGFLEYDQFDRQYDLITFWDFIEHPPKPSLYIQKVKNHLKPGGVFVLATPNVDNLLNKTAETLYKISGRQISSPMKKMYTVEHACYFDLRTLTELLDRNGFKIIHHFYTETYLDRYALPWHMKLGIKTFLLMNRILKKQNRLVVFAVKK